MWSSRKWIIAQEFFDKRRQEALEKSRQTPLAPAAGQWEREVSALEFERSCVTQDPQRGPIFSFLRWCCAKGPNWLLSTSFVTGKRRRTGPPFTNSLTCGRSLFSLNLYCQTMVTRCLCVFVFPSVVVCLGLSPIRKNILDRLHWAASSYSAPKRAGTSAILGTPHWPSGRYDESLISSLTGCSCWITPTVGSWASVEPQSHQKCCNVTKGT